MLNNVSILLHYNIQKQKNGTTRATERCNYLCVKEITVHEVGKMALLYHYSSCTEPAPRAISTTRFVVFTTHFAVFTTRFANFAARLLMKIPNVGIICSQRGNNLFPALRISREGSLRQQGASLRQQEASLRQQMSHFPTEDDILSVQVRCRMSSSILPISCTVIFMIIRRLQRSVVPVVAFFLFCHIERKATKKMNKNMGIAIIIINFAAEYRN